MALNSILYFLGGLKAYHNYVDSEFILDFSVFGSYASDINNIYNVYNSINNKCIEGLEIVKVFDSLSTKLLTHMVRCKNNMENDL